MDGAQRSNQQAAFFLAGAIRNFHNIMNPTFDCNEINEKFVLWMALSAANNKLLSFLPALSVIFITLGIQLLIVMK